MKIRQLMFLIFRQVIKPFWGSGLSRKFPPVYRVFRFLYTHLVTTDIAIVETEGNRLYADPSDDAFLSYLLTLPKVVKLRVETFKREVKEGMTVIDLGAHIGYFTLLAAKLVGEKGRVFAFEPAPNSYAFLTKNIAINGYKNVVPIQKAVSNRPGQAKLFLSDSSPANYLSNSDDEKGQFVIVDQIILDDFFKERGDFKVDFIKVNIEGSEPWALEGMSDIIRANRNIKIITELNAAFLRRAGSSAEQFLAKLTEFGFSFYDVGERGKMAKPCDVTSILKAYGSGRPTYLFCVKEE